MAVNRIGVLTGGGDAPGLNAVIRAVVKAAANARIECLGLEDSFDGLIFPERSRMLTPREVTGILRVGGTILGTTNRGNPFSYPVTTPDGSGRLLDALRREHPHARTRRHHRHRRRRHARHRARVSQARRAHRQRAEDDRQRHRRDDDDVRIRFGGGLRDRGDRSAAHDGRGASSRDGRRGDGPLRGLDRALLGPRRRRRRGADSGDSVRSRARRAAYSRARPMGRPLQHRRRRRGRVPSRRRQDRRCRRHGASARAARRHRRSSSRAISRG